MPDLFLEDSGDIAIVDEPKWTETDDGSLVLTDHLHLASYNPSATGRGNPWHDPRTGKFANGPPGVNVIRGGNLMGNLPNQSKWAVQERWKRSGGDTMAAAPAKDNRVLVTTFRAGKMVDQYYVSSRPPGDGKSSERAPESAKGRPPGSPTPHPEVGVQHQADNAIERKRPAGIQAPQDELRRRENAVHQAAMSFGGDMTLDQTRDFLRRRTSRPLSSHELIQFHDDVKRSWVNTIADGFDERKHSESGKAVDLPKRISDAWLRDNVSKMNHQDSHDLVTALRDRGWDQRELSERVLPHMPSERRRRGKSTDNAPPVPQPQQREHPNLQVDFARWLQSTQANDVRNLAGDQLEELTRAREALSNEPDQSRRNELEKHISQVEEGLRGVLREITKREARHTDAGNADSRQIADALSAYGDPSSLDPFGGKGLGGADEEAKGWAAAAIAGADDSTLTEALNISNKRGDTAGAGTLREELASRGAHGIIGDSQRARALDIANALDSIYSGHEHGKGIEFPRRLTQDWVKNNLPNVQDHAEIYDAIDILRSRGWTQREFDERVVPFLSDAVRSDVEHYLSSGERSKAGDASPGESVGAPHEPEATRKDAVKEGIASQHREEYFETGDPKRRPRATGAAREGEPESIEQLANRQLYEIRRIQAALEEPTPSQEQRTLGELVALDNELRNSRRGMGDRSPEEISKDIAVAKERLRSPSDYPAVRSGAMTEDEYKRELKNLEQTLKPGTLATLKYLQEGKQRERERGDVGEVATGLDAEKLQAEARSEMREGEATREQQMRTEGGMRIRHEPLTDVGEPSEEDLRNARQYELREVHALSPDEIRKIAEEELGEEEPGKGIMAARRAVNNVARKNRSFDEGWSDSVKLGEDWEATDGHLLVNTSPITDGSGAPVTGNVGLYLDGFRSYAGGGHFASFSPHEARVAGEALKNGRDVKSAVDTIGGDGRGAASKIERLETVGNMDKASISDTLLRGAVNGESGLHDAQQNWAATQGKGIELPTGDESSWLNDSIAGMNSGEIKQLRDQLSAKGWSDQQINSRVDPHVGGDARKPTVADGVVNPEMYAQVMREHTMPALQGAAETLGVNPDELKALYERNMQHLLNDSYLKVNVPEGAWANILTDGHLDRGMFEASHELPISSQREHEWFHGDLPSRGPGVINGYFDDGSGNVDARIMGNADIVLKSSNKDRATVSFEQIGEFDNVAPSPSTHPSVASIPSDYMLNGAEDTLAGIGGGRLPDAQIHGDITLDDIEGVEFIEHPQPLVARALNDSGIPWSVHMGDNESGSAESLARVEAIADALDSQRGKGVEIPGRVRDRWLHGVLPTLSTDEEHQLLNTLQSRGWTEDEISARVRPYLPSRQARKATSSNIREGDRVKAPDSSKIGTVDRVTKDKVFVKWDDAGDTMTPVGYAHDAGLKKAQASARVPAVSFGEGEHDLASATTDLESVRGAPMSPVERENFAAHLAETSGRVKTREIGQRYLAALNDARREESRTGVSLEPTGREISRAQLASSTHQMLSSIGKGDDAKALDEFFHGVMGAVGGRKFSGTTVIRDSRDFNYVALAKPNGDIHVSDSVIDHLRLLGERYRSGDRTLRDIADPNMGNDGELINFLVHESVHQMFPQHMQAAANKEYALDMNAKLMEEGLTETIARHLTQDMLDELEMGGHDLLGTSLHRSMDTEWVRDNFLDPLEGKLQKDGLEGSALRNALKDELLKVFDEGMLTARLRAMDSALVNNGGSPLSKDAIDKLPEPNDMLRKVVGGKPLPSRLSDKFIDSNVDKLSEDQLFNAGIQLAGFGNKDKMRRILAALASRNLGSNMMPDRAQVANVVNIAREFLTGTFEGSKHDVLEALQHMAAQIALAIRSSNDPERWRSELAIIRRLEEQVEER